MMPNELMPNEPQNDNRATLVVIGGGVLIVIIVLIAAWFLLHPKSSFTVISASPTASATPSPSASATASPTAYPTPTPRATPIILGLDGMVNVGLTSVQANDVQYALNQYSSASGKHLQEIDIDQNSISAKHDQSTGGNVLSFKATLDQTTAVTGKVNYSDLTSIELFLYDTNGTLLYDSKTVSNK